MPVALDTEFVPSTNAEPVGQLVSVATACETGCGLWPAHAANLGDYVAGCYDAGIILAFAPVDTFVLLRAFPRILPNVVAAYEAGRVYDILTREKMIDTALGQRKGKKYNLGAVGERRAGVEVDKEYEGRMLYGELLGLEVEDWPEDAREYAANDPAATYAIYLAQEQHRAEHHVDVFAVAANDARAHVNLYAQTLRGILTDQEQVEKVDRRLVGEITQHAIRCLKTGLARVGGTRAKPKIVCTQKAAAEMVEAYCADLGRAVKRTKPSKTHEHGKVSLSEATLKALKLPKDDEGGDHPLDDYRKLGAKQALRSKNIRVLRHPRIRTRYDECKETGRTGSSAPQGTRNPDNLEAWEWVGSNLQNQPQEGGFRECLVPPPGYVFVISDFGGAELVSFAQVQLDLFGTSRLAEVLIAGGDPHAEMGARLLGIPIEEFDKENPEHKLKRKLAKPLNFGYPGGLGARTFVDFASRHPYNFELTEAEAKRLKRLWMEQWPEVVRYFRYVDGLQGADGWITVIHPRSGRVRGRCSYTEACNSHFQELAANGAKTALWDLWRAGLDPASPLFGGVPVVSPDGRLGETGQVLFVHDENVTVVRREVAEAAKQEQERIMIESFGHWCPDVPIKVESVIAERYTK